MSAGDFGDICVFPGYGTLVASSRCDQQHTAHHVQWIWWPLHHALGSESQHQPLKHFRLGRSCKTNT